VVVVVQMLAWEEMEEQLMVVVQLEQLLGQMLAWEES
jgi:hypothetical protein